MGTLPPSEACRSRIQHQRFSPSKSGLFCGCFICWRRSRLYSRLIGSDAESNILYSDKVCKVLYAPVASRKLLESRHAVDPESLSHDGQLLLSWGSSTDCSDLTSTGINGHKVPVFYTPHDQHALEEVPGAHIEQFLPEIVPFFKRNIGERNPLR